MNIKKKKIMLISSMLLTLIIVVTTIILINNKDNNIYNNNKVSNNINNGFLTLMLEQDDGTYQESTSNIWPEDGYAFNSNLSRCENGGELSWDRESNIVKLISNKSDRCYVYFDLYNVVKITNVSTSKTYNSVTLTATVEAGENPIAKYYFSNDGGKTYQESTSPNYTFSNLTANTKYTFQVYAEDTLGYASNEEVIEVTTDNYVNPVVNSVSATSVSNDSITVSVSATVGTSSISRYYYSSNNGSSYSNSTSNTYTFSGLSSGTTYQIRVYVIDSNGEKSNEYTLSVQTDDTMLLADYIKGLYTSQGSNGLYYHTSSLANSAADNSYRYAGANPNNYVCFGSTAATCPTDNLYRIIGVFDDEVKLIKADYTTTAMTGSGGDYDGAYDWPTSDYKGNMSTRNVASYFWNYSTSVNTWSESNLNLINLNQTFLNSFTEKWKSKITNHTWKTSGLEDWGTPKEMFEYELGSKMDASDTTNAKIGLIYVSDYAYTTINTNWKLTSGFQNYNWMYMGLSEWTISKLKGGEYDIYESFYIDWEGEISKTHISYFSHAIRPCFYLTSSTTYVSGSGTSTDPIRIN